MGAFLCLRACNGLSACATLATHSHTKGKTMRHYISVTIGHNYGNHSDAKEWLLTGQPLSDSYWAQFKQNIRDDIAEFCTIEGVIFDGTGEGTWDDDSEQSFHYAVIVSDYDAKILPQRLQLTGSTYCQDAVGFVVVPLPNGDETLLYCPK